jgi:hypothetical protein
MKVRAADAAEGDGHAHFIAAELLILTRLDA